MKLLPKAGGSGGRAPSSFIKRPATAAASTCQKILAHPRLILPRYLDTAQAVVYVSAVLALDPVKC